MKVSKRFLSKCNDCDKGQLIITEDIHGNNRLTCEHIDVCQRALSSVKHGEYLEDKFIELHEDDRHSFNKDLFNFFINEKSIKLHNTTELGVFLCRLDSFITQEPISGFNYPGFTSSLKDFMSENHYVIVDICTTRDSDNKYMDLECRI